jgi:hypothetical protein
LGRRDGAQVKPKGFLERAYVNMSKDYLSRASARRSGLEAARDIAVVKIGGSILTSAKAYRRAAIFVRDTLKANPEERIVVVFSANRIFS